MVVAPINRDFGFASASLIVKLFSFAELLMSVYDVITTVKPKLSSSQVISCLVMLWSLLPD